MIYVPLSRTITINGVTQNLSANRTWTIPTDDAVTLGTANGLSLSGQELSLGLASGTTTGALSSADWNTFNNKQPAGNYVTSVGLSLPNIFSVSGSPVTTSGTLTATLNTQNAYRVFATGSGNEVPAFQSLVINHLPNDIPLTKIEHISENTILGRQSGSGVIQELTASQVRSVIDVYSKSEVNSLLHDPVTLGTANGLSLVGQQLSLGLASSGVTGALSGIRLEYV